MHEVKRAVIMAAGLGKRMQPITNEIPKPLVKVNGQSMIETVLEGLLQNGITEIYIVVGYLKDRFTALQERYPNVNLLENTLYDVCNNISSLYVAREYLEDAIIIDGDQIIRDVRILTPFFEKSGYHATWCEGNTKEWLLQVEQGRIVSCSRTGGRKGWKLYGISRWTREDGRKLKRHLEIEFIEKGNTQIYWDDVPMFCHFEEYELGVFPMAEDAVVEIDSFEELCAIDPSYAK